MKHAGKNAVIAAALVAAGFLAAWLRFRPYLDGAEYTDGVTTFDPDDAESVRYAVWDAPEALGGGVNGDARETRPALSPDGRWLVFEVGERGLNADLYVAEVVDGLPGLPRRLAELDGPSDDCAPALCGDRLYFASDRPGGAGGLDLYRASFRDGRAGAIERLDGALQSPADDTDPAPRPDGDALVFASDRGGAGFELYEAARAGEGGWTVAALAGLGGAGDEREPAFTADGRTLFFASDRDGGAGDFDLYRATRLGDGWSEPAALAGLNTPAAERAPAPAFDDFSLYFARESAGSGLDLARARSLELVRRAAQPVGWLELLILAALLFAALLAWLAKRWPGLDTLYKCYLVSLIAHLLLLWLFQGLFVDSTSWRRGARRDGFQVRLEPARRGPAAASRERAGELESASRAASAEVQLARHAPASASFDAREAPALAARVAAPTPRAPDAPARHAGELARAPGVAPATEIAAPSDVLERRSGAGRELALVAAAEPASRSPVAADPARVSAPLLAPSREGSALAARVDGPVRRSLPAPERAALERRESDAREAEVALAAPRESFAARAVGASGELALEPAAAGPASRADAATAPARGAPELADASGDAEPSAGPGAAPELAPRARGAAAPERREVALAPAARAAAELQLDDAPAQGPRPALAAPAPAADLLEGFAAPALAARESLEARQPQRFAFAARERDAAPVPPEALVLASPPPREPEEPPRPARDLDATPFKNRSGAEKARALELYGGTRETEAAVAKGLDYLARIQRADGEWGDVSIRDGKYGEVAIGKTGLALLAFLGAGHTQASATEHSDTVGRALAFLLDAQDPESGHFGDSEAYSHGIATYALSECYALTGEPALREPLERAVRHIVENQSSRRDARLFGGWSYFYPDGRVYDRWPRTAITVWQVMALESARLAGLDVPRRVFDDARTFLENARDPEEDWYRYNHDPARLSSGWPTLPASTPAALFALALFGEELASARYDAPRRFVLERAPREYRRGSDDDFVFRGQGNLYFWYYGTLAMFRTGGASWQRWNAAMKDALVRGQSPDGSWAPIDVYAGYARDGERDKSYSTAMCVLSLEVYYRYYLPLLQVR